MTEIEALTWNGYNVVSTFSGAGGSCLGYRMAGYRVLWASEFIPAAQEVYKLNHPNSILDTRDIREVQPQDILDAIGLKVGKIDILDGSPPCASFSTSGKREKGWGEVKKYSNTKQRVDDLFFEYARLLKGLQPKVFVAENVSGLIKSTAKGYFKEILQALKDCGYQVKAKLLDAQWLGVPQMRQRLIFIGVRNDLELKPTYPSPFDYQYTSNDALPERVLDGDCWWLPDGKMRHMYDAVKNETRYKGRWEDTHIDLYRKRAFFNHRTLRWGQTAPTIVQGSQSIYHPDKPRSLTIPELKRFQSLPDDFQLTGSFSQQWERIGRMVPPIMMQYIAKTIQIEILDNL